MISLDTNVLARAIASEIDADAMTKQQRKRAQALLSSGRAPAATQIPPVMATSKSPSS